MSYSQPLLLIGSVRSNHRRKPSLSLQVLLGRAVVKITTDDLVAQPVGHVAYRRAYSTIGRRTLGKPARIGWWAIRHVLRPLGIAIFPINDKFWNPLVFGQ